MLCHYCGYRCAPPDDCPQCRSIEIIRSIPGTERIEQEIAMYFPNILLRRLDSDAAQRRGVLERTLADFRQRRFDLLLGTQMVAKGLNFPGVQLVGILQADSGLAMPDFRAQERLFALITQVAGRAGRYLPTTARYSSRPCDRATGRLHWRPPSSCRASTTRSYRHAPR